MLRSCEKMSHIFMGSFEETALMAGISDIIVVEWLDGSLHCSPFLVCFGSLTLLHQGAKASIIVNGILLSDLHLQVNKYGYLHPLHPSTEFIAKLNLRPGVNSITFQLQEHSLSSEIHLYAQTDQILVSDVDGTMTRSDFRGLLNNFRGNDYLHQGYAHLIRAVQRFGYRIVWLTMRSMALYHFSKEYIQNFTRCQGVLLTEPEQFFPAFKKELMKQTGSIKTNMMMMIRSLFPSNREPFCGGLGNRENDAIAYLAAGIKKSHVFIIDKQSQVHKLSQPNKPITYSQIHKEIQNYFPSRKRKIKVTMSLSNLKCERKALTENQESTSLKLSKSYQSLLQ